ncbi:N-acetylmuramoyl-L-alanine amidase [Laedolimicola ammoniilytica]|uniref:N-acetylmuramoyl-L-alanine amidase n=1 Tax=Laedolimicola ammoniilytica TaxID=2981771 RepID=A0ABT2RWC6_9FIRM|nr:N-acetylmuramoyl-L-alanine amidase [Laedolimicola ammoniilytica]MCU6696618.1 N-acetylmuramoyl-L-alanine amidase [Laedolimicola ammoniilytica]SCH79653.1 N-acetylmuramoyl-L-alanine amidase [uncultured Clostridium sp.]
MKRKIVRGLLAGLLAVSLWGCGKDKTDEAAQQESVTVAEEEESEADVADDSGAEGETVDGADERDVQKADTASMEEDTEATDAADNSEPADDASVINYEDGQLISLDDTWQYADHSAIHSGAAVLYRAAENRKDIIIGVNAGHGTSGGSSVKTLCHPDGSAKTTGGSTGAGATRAAAVSGGMTFQDGTPEKSVTLRMAQIFRDRLLAAGYDVLMLRDGDDVQLDNVARTVICNNVADCHIALHWDGDGLSYDKGCFYISVPDALKSMEPVASHWQQHDALGAALIAGLQNQGAAIYKNGQMSIDLTQTSYSTIPSVDMELGNACSDHSDEALSRLADGLIEGVNGYFD